MMFFFFFLSWIFSPKYGLVSTQLRRRRQQQRFDDQVVLAHINNHEGTPREQEELAVETLYSHFRWSPRKTKRLISQLQIGNYVHIQDDKVRLTSRGRNRVRTFRETQLARETAIQ